MVNKVEEAKKYWEQCNCTYRAGSDVYEKQSMVIDALKQIFNKNQKVLDVGCGDGRFTFQLAHSCGAVDAFDLSPELIKAAQLCAKKNNINNTNFFVNDLENMKIDQFYDIIACMGVLVTVTDDALVESTINKFIKMTNNNAFLLVKESVMEYGQRTQVEAKDGYIATYRNDDIYQGYYKNNGCIKIFDQTIHRWMYRGQSVLIKMYVFKV